MTAPLISIRNLCVDYITDAGDVRAVTTSASTLHQAKYLA